MFVLRQQNKMYICFVSHTHAGSSHKSVCRSWRYSGTTMYGHDAETGSRAVRADEKKL